MAKTLDLDIHPDDAQRAIDKIGKQWQSKQVRLLTVAIDKAIAERKKETSGATEHCYSCGVPLTADHSPPSKGREAPGPNVNLATAHAVAQFKKLNVDLRRQLKRTEKERDGFISRIKARANADDSDLMDYIVAISLCEATPIHKMPDAERAQEMEFQRDEADARADASMAQRIKLKEELGEAKAALKIMAEDRDAWLKTRTQISYIPVESAAPDRFAESIRQSRQAAAAILGRQLVDIDANTSDEDRAKDGSGYCLRGDCRNDAVETESWCPEHLDRGILLNRVKDRFLEVRQWIEAHSNYAKPPITADTCLFPGCLNDSVPECDGKYCSAHAICMPMTKGTVSAYADQLERESMSARATVIPPGVPFSPKLTIRSVLSEPVYVMRNGDILEIPRKELTPYESSRLAFKKYAGMDAPRLPDDEHSALQVLLSRWENKKFASPGAEESVLGVNEENGEWADALIMLAGATSAAGRMAQCIMTRKNRQRGMEDSDTYREALADAVADLAIFAIGACTKARLDFWTIVAETAIEVMDRNRPGKEPTNYREDLCAVDKTNVAFGEATEALLDATATGADPCKRCGTTKSNAYIGGVCYACVKSGKPVP